MKVGVMMKLGYACTPISIDKKTTRSFILKNFSEEKLKECVLQNLNDLLEILKWNNEKDIKMFRISSDIVPFGSHDINNICWDEIFSEKLKSIGEYIKSNDLRVSMHPGQYTILSSPSEDIVRKSIKDIVYHTKFLDSLNVPYCCKIILHIGGVYDSKEEAIKRFIKNFYKLPPSSQKRLIIENDERCYTIEDVLKISKEINVPVVFDNLHHKINPSLNDDISYILKEVHKTWKPEDGSMKIHYSDQNPLKKPGSHSPTVVTDNFFKFLHFIKPYQADVMLETKDKDLSALKIVNCLKDNLDKSTISTEWAKYKYVVMEKSYSHYKECGKISSNNKDIRKLYSIIDNCLLEPFNVGNYTNALEHVFGYIKNNVSQKEKENFFAYLKNKDNLEKAKTYLKRLVKKYNVTYILNSYYFKY